MILPQSFYTRDDVVLIAKELLGKVLFTSFEGILTSGIIAETEAYAGIIDCASHAYNGKRTTRTEIMYRVGGTAYVYLCYGVHSMFNVVTSVEDTPHAILIRSVKPYTGIDKMKLRVNKEVIGIKEGTGPGNVTKLLGIHFSHSGLSLVAPENGHNDSPLIWIEDRKIRVEPLLIQSGPRIGVGYAGDDALLPYRFRISL